MSNIDVPQTTLSSTAVAPKAIETAPVNRASGTMQIASVLDQLARPPLLGENEPAIASSQKSLEIALKDVNSTLATSSTNLSFTVDPSSKRTVIEVKDGETGDTILKLPGDAILRIAANIESLKGILFDENI
jgi:flagellar protein FlaG